MTIDMGTAVRGLRRRTASPMLPPASDGLGSMATAATIGSRGRLDDIISSAAELFDQAGYSNVSMEEIAEAVGLAKPSLYHYVKSKEEILYLTHRAFMAVAFRALRSRPETLSAESAVRAVISDIISVIADHRPLVRVFFEHYRDLGKREQRTVFEQRDAYASALIDTIKRGIKNGEFRRTADPTIVALGIFGMCNWAYQWYDPRGALTPHEISEMFSDMVLAGIRSEARRSPPRRARGATVLGGCGKR